MPIAQHRVGIRRRQRLAGIDSDPTFRPFMPLSREELDDIAARTRAHYGERAESFRDSTRGHDVSQNITALLSAVEGAPPFTILDFGCGPGRDLAARHIRP